MFWLETIEIFAGIFPNKLNYEPIVDREVSKSPYLLKITSQEISEATPRPVLWKRCLENILQILLIYQSSSQYYTINKPLKDFIFNKTASLFLATLLRKWTS